MATGYRGPAAAVMLAAMSAASVAHAGSGQLTVTIGGLDGAGRLPASAAFCPPAGQVEKNISPPVSWTQGPAGTRSYALLMVDPDVPADLSLINRPGTTIAADAARITVHHWVLVDIPPDITALAAGVEGRGVVAHGKPFGVTAHGRRGANGYTGFLASNPGMAGTYGGYDGPCPPANDARIHRYVVRVFALDLPSLGLDGAFEGPAATQAMQGHVLAEGEASASYAPGPP